MVKQFFQDWEQLWAKVKNHHKNFILTSNFHRLFKKTWKLPNMTKFVFCDRGKSGRRWPSLFNVGVHYHRVFIAKVLTLSDENFRAIINRRHWQFENLLFLIQLFITVWSAKAICVEKNLSCGKHLSPHNFTSSHNFLSNLTP